MTLCSRFAFSAQPTIPLTQTQLRARDHVAAALASGRWCLHVTPCFCGERQEMVIAERDRYGLPVRTVLCPRCGLLRSSPRLADDAAAAFYDEAYRELYSSPLGPEQLFAEQLSRGRLYRQALGEALPTVELVYEVGCGAGGLLSAFTEVGKRVAGCDMGDEYLAQGRAEGLSLHHGDATSLLEARDGEQADLLLLIHVLEHFGDLRRELRETLRALKPGGLLLVDVPGLRAIGGSSCYRGDLLRYLQNAHNYHFTASTLRHVLESAGLEVLHCDESALAVARKPQHLLPRAATMPAGEARTTLRFLAELERLHQQRKRGQRPVSISNARP
jgi:SAM-dependent methyltransferase